MAKILTFGEMMLRLKTPNNERIIQANTFEATYGGAEANVAVSLAQLGNQVTYLSKFPANLLGDTALSILHKYGVNTDKTLIGGNRLGIYFFEKGASVRPTNVVYDRAYSSFATVKKSEFDWQRIFEGVDYFYFSGITPAISSELADTVIDACEYCHQHHITIICDLNYRGKMWSSEQAQNFMKKAMNYVNICIAHDEDFEATLGIQAFDGDSSNGITQKDSFKKAMEQVMKQYPNCKMIASILRDIHSVEDSQWMGLLLTDGKFYETPSYNMHVMEGVAAGDAFGAGLVHGIIHQFALDELIQFALAASVLKLTITGDLNLISEREIRDVMESSSGARLKR